MKKKLTLSKVLDIKNAVEKLLQAAYSDIIKYNSSDTSIDSLLSRSEKLGNQLVHLKEVIQTANQAMYGNTCNNTRIYTLSNLKTKKSFYETLLKSTSKKKLQLDKKTIKETLSNINEEIKQIEEQLTVFNNKKKVTVVLDSDLDLVPERYNNKIIRRLFQKL